ncbi:MAG: phosphate/phosphite/phosphonate ABC transporter substrate-binding protein [Solirubrobacteraceae bacterium]|nr:phosphate/phosphite/phosphonate ABC transporter substrate-binding protein [Solirubrobacteraceae bacterium]
MLALRARAAAFVALVGVAVATTLAATAGGAGDDEDRPRFAGGSCGQTAVRLGFALPVGDTRGRLAADEIGSTLADLLACPVQVVVRERQEDLVADVALQRIDLAQLDPAALVVVDRVASINTVGAYATGLDLPARGARSQIWVRRGDDARTLADLRGRRLALGPRLTVGGDVEPRTALMAAGLRPGDDVRTVRTATDADALEALERGRVDAAVTRGPVAVRGDGPRRLWRSDPLLADVLGMRTGLPRHVRRLILASVRTLPARVLAPFAVRLGVRHPTPLVSVPLDLYGPVQDQLDALTAEGLAP